jgi:hypothetical protein
MYIICAFVNRKARPDLTRTNHDNHNSYARPGTSVTCIRDYGFMMEVLAWCRGAGGVESTVLTVYAGSLRLKMKPELYAAQVVLKLYGSSCPQEQGTYSQNNS